MLDDLLRRTQPTTVWDAKRSFTLPGKPDYFIGRDRLLVDLHQQLSHEKSLLLVNGLGGIGKTTLAQAYIHHNEYAKLYDHIAWVTVKEALASDLVSAMQSALQLELQQQATLEEQLDAVLTALRQIPGQNLLVLDNANHAEELTAWQAALKTAGWLILITSRCEPDEYPKLPVDELPPDDARVLFVHYYAPDDKTHAEYPGLHDLLNHINRHTLLTELLAKAGRKKGLTPAQIYERLRAAISATRTCNAALPWACMPT